MDIVAIYCTQYPPYAGGGPNYYSGLVESLESEYSIIVITSYHVEEDIITNDGGTKIYRIIPVLAWLPWIFRLVLETTVSFISFTVLLTWHSVDLLHSQSTSYAIPGIVVSTILTRVPVIYDCRDEAFPKRAIQIGNTPLWFSASTNIDHQLVQAGVSSGQIIRTPVINPPYVSEYVKKDVDTANTDSYNICFCGKFRPEKNVPLIVDAFAEILEDSIEANLTLIGDGLMRKEVEYKIEDNDVDDRVEITGELSHREALKKLSSCDVLILPSESEGLPRVIMEALELGIPVVTTDAGGIGDVIEDRKTGIIVDLNRQSITEGLKRIHKDNEIREQLIENGKRQVSQLEWDRVVDQVSEAYDDVLANA